MSLLSNKLLNMPSQYTSLSLNFAHQYCLLRKFDLLCINILLYSVLWSKSSSIFNCCWDSCSCTKKCWVTLVSTKLSIHFFGIAFRSISNSKMKFDVILNFSLILIGHSLKSCNTSAIVISPHWAQWLKSKDFPLNFIKWLCHNICPLISLVHDGSGTDVRKNFW